jgi:hypothetical protein
MQTLLAHVTQNEFPVFWLTGIAGFVAGVLFTLAMFAWKRSR